MRPKEKNTQSGQSLVEFAISLVLLLLMLSVIVDGARALFTYLTMRDAAQEAASYASYQPRDETGIFLRACAASNMMTDLCDASSLTFARDKTGTDFCMDTSSTGVANGITISIEYPDFPLAMPFVGTFIGSQTVPIGTEVTDTILSPACP